LTHIQFKLAFILAIVVTAYCPAAAVAQDPPPDSDVTMLNLGKAAFDAGRYDEALRDFFQFKEKRPNNLALHFWLGATLTALRQQEKGTAEYINCLKLAASIGMDSPEMRNNLASNLLRSGFLKEPLFDYQRAIFIDPRSAPPYLGLAKCLIETGNFDDALVALNKYREAGGLDLNALLLHGLAMAGKEKLEPAKEDLTNFINIARNGGNRGPLDRDLSSFSVKYVTAGGVSPQALQLAQQILDEIQQRQ